MGEKIYNHVHLNRLEFMYHEIIIYFFVCGKSVVVRTNKKMLPAPVILLLHSTPVFCINILGVFMVPSFSHQRVFQSVWSELSLRGNNVTVVTPDPLNDPSLTNLTEISLHFSYVFLKQIKIHELMSNDSNIFLNLDATFRFMDLVAEAQLNSSQFKELIDDQTKQFDLILIESFHPVMYALAGRFKAPIIAISARGVMAVIYTIFGNPTHPVLYPDALLNFHNGRLSLWNKIKSVLWNLWSWYYHHAILVPRGHETAMKYFGVDMPYIGDIEANQSLFFLNTNPLVYPPRPIVPVVVETGQIHIKPVKPLPEDLQQILDGATEGVIYFSLGSNVKSVNLENKVKNTIRQALSEVPYKVLWKWESDYLPGRPKNVVTRKWFPQQDVLAHRNIRAFVTQGGLQSIEEAIFTGVPLIGMPFMRDQPMNVQKLIDMGIGLGVDPVIMSKEELKKRIIEVAENNKYRERIQQIRDILYDKPMTGLEKVVWWTEYVVRHKGAKHLRSPTVDFSWYDYLLVEVVLTAVVMISTIVYFSYKVIQLLL
ncbi:UDP-glycosyltransferase UGT5-like [Zophobas morio]|uniref:UDP-glycosyltransferase UGT5-like n=1 Tax=Zophobas morio TaxID=2755281 RepID=UPI00308280C2